MKERVLDFEPPLEALRNLRSTSSMPGDPTLRSRGNEIVRSMNTPDGPATLYLRQDRESVQAKTWGQGSDWVLYHLPAMIGLADDSASEFEPTQEPVRSFHKRRRGLRIAKSLLPFETTVTVVLLQKVVGKEAAWSYRRMLDKISDRAPGPLDLPLPPTPEQLLGLSYEEFHPFGVERHRADIVKRVARHAKKLHRLVDLPLPEARELLGKLPGIGPWTVNKVAAAALGDPDAVHTGDYHLPHVVGFNLTGEPRSSDERMLELLEPFRGHRARAVRLIETEGRSAPKYGPRMAFRHIERW